MGSIGYTTDLFGKGSLTKMFGVLEGCTLNSFTVFFVFSDIIIIDSIFRVGVAV